MIQNFQYIKLDVIVDIATMPPLFLGSQLRGALGVALKRVVCINPQQICHGCFATTQCLYHAWYENPNSYHPYRFDIEVGQKTYDFGFFVFGSACQKLPFIVSALEMMVTQIGLGGERVCGRILSIQSQGQMVYDGRKFDLHHVEPKKVEPKMGDSHELNIEFVTPLRMKHDNKLLKNVPSLMMLVNSIQHRLEGLGLGEFSRLPDENLGIVKEGKVRFIDLTRYSNRQKTKMQLGGITGHVAYAHVDPTARAYLELGEIIGVGKSTVFGLGKIKIEDEK